MPPSPRTGDRPPAGGVEPLDLFRLPPSHHASHASIDTLASLDSVELEVHFPATPPPPPPAPPSKPPRRIRESLGTRLAAVVIHAAGLLAVAAFVFGGFLALRASSNLFRASTARPPLAAQRSFISISSDDYGRVADSVPLQPDSAFIEGNPDLQLVTRPGFTPWYTRASVETAADLRNLHAVLSKWNVNVSFDQRAVLTPHFVVGGPDFDAMRRLGCGDNGVADAPASSLTAADLAAIGPQPLERSQLHNSVRPRSGSPSSEEPLPHRAPSHMSPLASSSSSRHGDPSHQRTNSLADLRHRQRSPSFARPLSAQARNMAFEHNPAFSTPVSTNMRSMVHFRSDLHMPPTTTATAFARCTYAERLLSRNSLPGSSESPFFRGDLRPLYDALYKDGLWHPEFHGRSHFNVPAWISALRSGDGKAVKCFQKNMVCATDSVSLRSEFTGFDSLGDLKEWLAGGVNAFVDYFGYQPLVISSPHNAWSSWLADSALGLGFFGAELAEDQEAYITHSPSLSLHDRFRFDVFFPGFQCDRAIDEVVKLLRVPGPKTLRDHWYDFLSLIDLFRVHYVPYHHSPGGNHERFLSLMWHAQNTMSSTYSAEQHRAHVACMERAIQTVRETLPRTVFVTASELHQIRVRGWSAETWHDRVVLRNYATRSVEVRVPDGVGSGKAHLSVMSGHAGRTALPSSVSAGDLLTLPPDTALQIEIMEGKNGVR